MAYRIRDWNEHFETPESRKLKYLKWVAVPNKSDGEGYTALVDHPNGAAHLGAWYAIVETASRQDPRGNLPVGIPQDIGGICRSLGRMSRLPPEIFIELLDRLRFEPELDWIEGFTEGSGESPGSPGENPDTSAGKGTEGNRTEEKGKTHAPTADHQSVVRPDVSAGPGFEDFWKIWWNRNCQHPPSKSSTPPTCLVIACEISKSLAGHDRYHARSGYTTSKAGLAAYLIDDKEGYIGSLFAPVSHE